MQKGVSFAELLHYEEEEVERWGRWFEQQPPAALEVPIGEGETPTVRGLLVHIFNVEQRYADRLLGIPPTPYESLRTGSLAEIFEIGVMAGDKMRKFLRQATEQDLAQVMKFGTRSVAGTFSASKRKIAAHAILHGVRHWAQIAIALRQHGYRQDWKHDFLGTTAMP